jgi:hypothetical protein
MTSLMVTFRTFSFLDFLADLLQKSISVAGNLFAACPKPGWKSVRSNNFVKKTWVQISRLRVPCEGPCLGYKQQLPCN